MNWAPLETEALISVVPSEAERRGAAAGDDELGADHSFCKNKVVEEEIGLCTSQRNRSLCSKGRLRAAVATPFLLSCALCHGRGKRLQKRFLVAARRWVEDDPVVGPLQVGLRG